MSAKHGNKSGGEISTADFPALREFLGGYFHQDMADEYGSAEGAARQFCKDADAGQRKAVAEEWVRLVKQVTPLTALNEVLTKRLGSACTIEQDEIKRISAVFCGSDR
jgi:contact-dependent growth inhibition (CDI) system CdiI-like immunity protein